MLKFYTSTSISLTSTYLDKLPTRCLTWSSNRLSISTCPKQNSRFPSNLISCQCFYVLGDTDPKSSNHPFIPWLSLTPSLIYKYIQSIPGMSRLHGKCVQDPYTQVYSFQPKKITICHLDSGNNFLSHFPTSTLAIYKLFSIAQ